MSMNGYEPTPKDIQVVLKHLRAVKPDATEEDATNLLLKYKMDTREQATTTSHEDLLKELDRLITEMYGEN